MLRHLFCALLLTILLVPDAAATRRARLQDLLEQPVPMVDGQPASAAVLEKAMRAALAEHQWTIMSAEPGHFHVSTLVRSKHYVEADVYFTATRYSVVYARSQKLAYLEDGRGRMIHPNYMKWVRWVGDSFLKNLTAAGAGA